MSPRDTLLICSDGLSDNLSTDEIIAIIRCGPLDQSMQKLIDLATSRMNSLGRQAPHPSKPDDLTMIAFRRTPLPGERRRSRKPVKSGHRRLNSPLRPKVVRLAESKPSLELIRGLLRYGLAPAPEAV